MSKFYPPNTTTAIRVVNTPAKGELLFDTDLNKLFIGDGVTQGGIEVGTGSGGGSFDSPTTTKGDLIVRGETEDTRLAVGAENTFLSPDPASPTGLTWKNPVLGGAMLFDNAIESVQVTTPELADGESAIVYADISRTYLLTKIEEIYGKSVDTYIFSNANYLLDPYESNVVLLLKGDGFESSTNIIDSSSNNIAITRFGNTKISTVQSKYGGSSLYFDGNGDYLRADAALTGFTSTSEPFCLEFWVYLISNTSSPYIIGLNSIANGNNVFLYGANSTNENIWVNNVASGISIPNLPLDTWVHVAIVYTDSSFVIYHNGLQVAVINIALSTSLSDCVFGIGGEFDSANGGTPGNYINGYIDSLRLTKGNVRYNSNFDPEKDTYLGLPAIASYQNFTTQTTSLLGYIDQPSLGNKVPLRVTNRSGAATTLTLNLDVIKTSATNLSLAKGLDNPPKYYQIVSSVLAPNESEVLSVDFPRVYILSDLQANYDCGFSVYSRYDESLNVSLNVSDNNIVLLFNNLQDESSYNHAISFSSITLSSSITKFNQSSLAFSGASTLNTINLADSILEGNSSFQVDVWVYRTSNKANNHIFEVSGNNRLAVYITSGGSVNLANMTAVWGTIGSGFQLNVWQLLTITKISNTLYLFRDGELLGTTVLNANSTTFTNPMIYLGNDLGGTANSFTGYMTSFRIKTDNFNTSSFSVPNAPYSPFLNLGINLLQSYSLTANTNLETNLLGFNEDPADSQVKVQITNTSTSTTAITVDAELILMQPAEPNYKFDNAPTEVSVATSELAPGASEIVRLPYPRVCVLSDLTANSDCDVEFYSRYDESSAPVDPYWNNVVLYLKGDGENDSTNIIDSSPNPKTITLFGDTKISTAQSKYGGSSLSFLPRSTTTYLSIPASNDFQFTGDFTIDIWVYWDGVETTGGCVFLGTGGIGSADQLGIFSGVFLGYGSVSWGNIGTITNQWTHLAISRSGSSVRAFKNGIQLGSTVTNGNTIGSNIDLFIGKRRNNDHPFGGYIDSLRITKGVARYTADFNPETDTYLAPANASSLQSYSLTANTTQETNLLTFNEDPSDSYLKALITNTTASPATITLTTEIIPVFSPTGMTWRLATVSQQAEAEVGYFFDTDQPVTLTLPSNPAIGSTVYCGLLQTTTLTVSGNTLPINSGGDVNITTVGQLHRFIYTNPTYGWFYEQVTATGGGGGTGDMEKTVYDTNDDGIVDLADAIAGSPLANQYYGTDEGAVKGFFPLPSGTGGSGLTFAYSNTSFTPEENTLNAVDTIASAITATLPLNPIDGTIIAFYDYLSNFDMRTLTVVAPTGNNILGGSQLVLNTKNATIQLVYYSGRWSVFGTEVFVDKVGSGESTGGDSISFIVAGAIG